MKSKKYIFLLVLIGFLIVFCCFLEVSYSFVSRTKTSYNTFSISTSNLSSNLTITAENVTLKIMSDEEGLNQDSYAIIDISKDNAYSVFYNLTIGYSGNIPDGANYEDLLPLEFVDVALYEMEGNNISSTPVNGPTKIGNLPVISVDPSNKYNDKYNLFFATFNPNSQNAKYALKVWLDEDTPEYLDGKLVVLNMGIKQSTKVSQSFYNFSGVVKDNNGQVISNATISLHNGTVNTSQNLYMPSKAITQADGSFILYNVPTGTYNLKVTTDENIYETVIHVNPSDSVGVFSTPLTTGYTGDTIQTVAFQYYTTPYLIIKNNNMLITSNESATSNYTIPTSYLITGLNSLDTLDIDDLKLTCVNNIIQITR